jgi:hypothetical protein
MDSSEDVIEEIDKWIVQRIESRHANGRRSKVTDTGD